MKVGDVAMVDKDAFNVTMFGKQHIDIELGTKVRIVQEPDGRGDYFVEFLNNSSVVFYVNKDCLIKIEEGTLDITDLDEQDQKEILDLIEKKRRGVPKAKYIWIKKVLEDEGEDWEGVLATRTVYGRYCTFFEDGLGNPEAWDIGADAIYEWIDVERPF